MSIILQVAQGAVHCLKRNPAAAQLALAILKEALGAIAQDGTAVKRPGTAPNQLYNKVSLMKFGICKCTSHH